MDRSESKEDKSTEEREDHTLVLTEPVPEGHTVAAHYEQEDGQSLVQTIIMVIGAIILVVLLVLFARWIYHKVHSDQTSTTGTSQSPLSTGSNQAQPGVNQQPARPSNPGTSNGTSPQSAPNQNKTITNTGPGNVVAVFAGSTLAAAGLHYIISLRRFNKYGD